MNTVYVYFGYTAIECSKNGRACYVGLAHNKSKTWVRSLSIRTDIDGVSLFVEPYRKNTRTFRNTHRILFLQPFKIWWTRLYSTQFENCNWQKKRNMVRIVEIHKKSVWNTEQRKQTRAPINISMDMFLLYNLHIHSSQISSEIAMVIYDEQRITNKVCCCSCEETNTFFTFSWFQECYCSLKLQCATGRCVTFYTTNIYDALALHVTHTSMESIFYCTSFFRLAFWIICSLILTLTIVSHSFAKLIWMTFRLANGA